MTDVLLTITDGVAEVRLNRPDRRNAFRDQMYEGLLRAAALLRKDESVRAIVLTGEGATFCSGMDTSGFDLMRAEGKSAAWRPADADEVAATIVDVDGLTLGRGQRAVLVWTTMAVPVIAAVQGAAVGMGLQLALGADIRIVTPDATLGAYEIRWGLAPDGGGTQLLPPLIGFDRAMELCTTGRRVSGEEAVAMGLASTLADDPRSAALDLARTIAGRSPEAVGSVVRLLRAGRPKLDQVALIDERAEMHRNIGSDYQREAVAAAREGRDPVFNWSAGARPITEEVSVSGAASLRTLADLEYLVEHLRKSPVESGLRPEPLTVGRGHLTARLPLTDRTRTLDGRVSTFALGTFADLGVGVAVNSAVVDSVGGPTVELTVAIAGEPGPDARFLVLESEVVSVNSVTGIGRTVIRDDTGVVVAHAWGVMATSPGVADPIGEPATDRFDLRSVVVEPLTADFAQARVALDDKMVNNRGSVHGGVLTGIAMTVQDAFLGGGGWQGLTFTAQFLRPAVPDFGHLECRTEFVRRGRTFRTVRTRLLRPDGVVVLEATGTSVITTGTETS